MKLFKLKSQRQRVYERLFPYAKDHLSQIKVEMGDYNGFNKCQHVARQRLEKGEANTIIVVLSFTPKAAVNVHFINRKGKTYIDHTLGYLSQKNIYFFVEELSSEKASSDMNKLLNHYKDFYLSHFTPFEKFIYRINRNHI